MANGEKYFFSLTFMPGQIKNVGYKNISIYQQCADISIFASCQQNRRSLAVEGEATAPPSGKNVKLRQPKRWKLSNYSNYGLT